MVTAALMKMDGNRRYALRAAYHSTGVMAMKATRDQKMAIKGCACTAREDENPYHGPEALGAGLSHSLFACFGG